MATPTPFTLKVEGRAEIGLPAERAIINVTVSSSGLNKAAVSDEVITAARHVEALLRELSPKGDSAEAKAASPLAHWSKTSLSATSYFPNRNDYEEEAKKPARHYRSSIKFDIRFQEFRALGSFGARLSSVAHVEVQDIEWILTEETKLAYRPQMRQLAAKDAMARAQEYCDVLGCTNLRPVELDETGSMYSSNTRRYAMASQELGGGYGVEEHDDDQRQAVLEFTPQEVKMSMDIAINFHADAGVQRK